MTRRLVAVAIATIVAGCESVPQQAVTRCENATVVARPARTDILFVVDDSSSMQKEQQNLATNFDAFIRRLAASPVKLDYQIGITTTSVDRNGAAPDGTMVMDGTFETVKSGCPTPPPNAGLPYPAGALISVDASGRQLTSGPGRVLSGQLDPEALRAAFTRNVNVGVCGSGKEQPLRAARLALSDALLSGANAGFVRPGARLAVIIVSDDDDCSDPGDGRGHPRVQPDEDGSICESNGEAVQDFVDALKAPIAGEVRDVVVGAIVALDPTTLQPNACTVHAPDGSPLGTAENAAVRLKTFADAFGTKALEASVCDASFSTTLEHLAGLIDPGQTISLDQTPADWRLLAVAVAHADASASTACTVAADSAPNAAAADVLYGAPREGRPATLTFQNRCTLRQGDEVQMRLLCAG